MNCNTEIADEPVQSLHALLRQVKDHRAKRGRRYDAATVLVILLLAKLADESSLSGIAHWAGLRQPWLKAVLGLKRLPCATPTRISALTWMWGIWRVSYTSGWPKLPPSTRRMNWSSGPSMARCCAAAAAVPPRPKAARKCSMSMPSRRVRFHYPLQ